MESAACMIQNSKIPADQLRAYLADLIATAPLFATTESLTEEESRWLARSEAVLSEVDSIKLTIDFRVARGNLLTSFQSREELLHPVLTAFYRMELASPVETQGIFIPAGDTWGGYAALVKVLGDRCKSILVVDPYLDGHAFCDFIPLVKATDAIQCLTEHSYRQSLDASFERFMRDRLASESLVEVRYAPLRSLHDRLIIIDCKKVWLVSQSLKDIAARSPASLIAADAELSGMKIQHYTAVWNDSI